MQTRGKGEASSGTKRRAIQTAMAMKMKAVKVTMMVAFFPFSGLRRRANLG